MPSEAHARSDGGARPGAVVRLLDPAFGLFAWALYFLIVYVPGARLQPAPGHGPR